MSNLRRPLVLGLSTCALLLMSSRVVRKNHASAARDGANLEPAGDEQSSSKNKESATARMQIEPASWSD